MLCSVCANYDLLRRYVLSMFEDVVNVQCAKTMFMWYCEFGHASRCVCVIWFSPK